MLYALKIKGIGSRLLQSWKQEKREKRSFYTPMIAAHINFTDTEGLHAQLKQISDGLGRQTGAVKMHTLRQQAGRHPAESAQDQSVSKPLLSLIAFDPFFVYNFTRLHRSSSKTAGLRAQRRRKGCAFV